MDACPNMEMSGIPRHQTIININGGGLPSPKPTIDKGLQVDLACMQYGGILALEPAPSHRPPPPPPRPYPSEERSKASSKSKLQRKRPFRIPPNPAAIDDSDTASVSPTPDPAPNVPVREPARDRKHVSISTNPPEERRVFHQLSRTSSTGTERGYLSSDADVESDKRRSVASLPGLSEMTVEPEEDVIPSSYYMVGSLSEDSDWETRSAISL